MHDQWMSTAYACSLCPAGCNAIPYTTTGALLTQHRCATYTLCSALRLVLQHVTFLEGHPGCLALQTAIASLRGNKVQAQHSLQVRFCMQLLRVNCETSRQTRNLQQLPSLRTIVEGSTTGCQISPVSSM